VAAVVSSPSDVLQLLSFAVRSEQSHLLLSPVPPHSEILSLPAKFLMRSQNHAVLSTMLQYVLDCCL
jgi:hypothetical protein